MKIQPKLESLDRSCRYTMHSEVGKDALNATISLLYDRWDTLRMQATSKQNNIEVGTVVNFVMSL